MAIVPTQARQRPGVLRWSLIIVLLLLVAACGGAEETGDAGDTAAESTPEPAAEEEPTEADDEEAAEELQTVSVLLPAESPIEYPHHVAETMGYYAAEGITITIDYSGGSSEVIQQLVGGNGDIGITCTGSIVEALSEGFTELRPVFTSVYGSIFAIGVPLTSDIQSVEDLEGRTIGISDPAGGEVPVVRGILRQAGLDPEQDVELLPIGEATAVGVRAIEQGQVDALGGSLSDFFGVSLQGLELRTVGGEEIADIPACGVVVLADYLEQNRELVEGFLRATAKGQHFGVVNDEAAVEILAEASPDTYGGEQGQPFMDAYLPFMTPPGDTYGDVSADSFERYFEFVQVEPPDVDLSTIVVSDLAEAANDFDHDAVAEDAENFSG